MTFKQHATALIVLTSMVLVGCNRNDPADALRDAAVKLDKGDADGAIRLLKSSLQSQPDSAAARELLAKSLLARGDAANASAEFRRAMTLTKQPDSARAGLAKSMLQEGQFAKVVTELEGAAPSDRALLADMKASLAAAHLALGDTKSAQSAVEQAMLIAPELDTAKIVLATLLQQTGKPSEALRVTEDVIAKAPENKRAWLLKSMLLLQDAKQRDEGIKTLERAVALDPNNIGARSLLISLLISKRDLTTAQGQAAELQKRFPGNAQAAFMAATVAFARQDYAAATTLLEPVQKIAPNDVQVLQLAGAIALESKKLLLAKKTLSSALSKAPDLHAVRQMLAQAYLLSGEPAKALATLQPLLDNPNASKNNAHAFSLAGEAYFRSGALEQSEKTLKAALEIDPSDAASRTYLALARTSSAGVETTAKELQETSKVDKGTVADLALIGLMQKNKNIKGALLAVDALGAKLPKNPTAANLRGQIALASGDMATARKEFQSALAIDEFYVPAIANLAKIDAQSGDISAARTKFENLVKAKPNNTQAEIEFSKLLIGTSAAKEEIVQHLNNAIKLAPTELEPRLILINNLLARKDARNALLAAQEATALLPNDPDVLDATGRAQVAAGDINQAVATFGKLTALEPNSPFSHMRLAGAYLAANNKSAAELSLKRALTAQPDFLPAQEALVELARSSNRYDDAMRLAKNIQRQHPNSLSGFLIEGVIESSRNNHAAAIGIYRSTLKRFPLVEVAMKLHHEILKSGDVAGANKMAADWLAGHSKGTVFYSYLGDLALAKEDYATAEKRFREVVILQPKNAPALNNIAWSMMKQGKPGAVAMAEQAVAISPDIAGLLDTLAAIYAVDGKLEKAIQTEKKASILAPADPVVRVNLARFYLQAKDLKAAKAELETVVGWGPAAGPALQEAKRLLKTI
jgi:putative PEP-CTERM system TPR-repeat lipoprotein